MKGERATWNALNREPTMDPSDMADIARQFMRYYTNLKDEERDMVYREGFTTYVHDVLSKIILCIKNKNIIFNYAAEQESLEDEIDGYTFKLPADSNTLRKIGARMHNCVFSYTDWIIGGSCTIVYAEQLGRPEICIELSSHKSVVQVGARGTAISRENVLTCSTGGAKSTGFRPPIEDEDRQDEMPRFRLSKLSYLRDGQVNGGTAPSTSPGSR